MDRVAGIMISHFATILHSKKLEECMHRDNKLLICYGRVTVTVY